MKKIVFLTLLGIVNVVCFGQITTIPAIIQKGYTGEVTIIFNPNQGNKGMVGATVCYAHTGLITSQSSTESDWKFVVNTTWCDKKASTKMTKDADGNWRLKISNIYTYYNCPTTTEIKKLAFVFNDGVNGGKVGKTSSAGDIFVALADAGLAARINAELPEISVMGNAVTFTCNSTESATLTLTQNGQTIATGSGTELVKTVTLSTAGDNEFIFTATNGTSTATDKVNTYVCSPSATEARPAGTKMGANYMSDPTKVTLCTYAAGCKNANDPSGLLPAQAVYVIGSFNNWKVSDNYQMKRDGEYFWITLTGCTPGYEYPYQYLVVRADGKIVRISDLYATRVRNNISNVDGYASILQTSQSAYQWSSASSRFVRPDKNNLVIYELWIYDHTASHNLSGLLGRLDYITNLGVNCVELMPVNEFDDNQSWGYNPNHYFAIDQQYGKPRDLKVFVDSCHSRGIAVVLDMVLNHSTGNNPMNKLYPYGDDLKYNPWFNVTPPHGDNVFEDWNHDFGPTHQMMIDVLSFWMDEYKVDGFRLDLSHGLCGKSYNAVTNLKDYYSKAIQPRGGYLMLEHWGSNMSSDRPQLVNAGMMCWQNTSNAFCQTAMGWLKDGDNFSDANMDNYVSYPENHDEERPFFKAKMWGDGNLQTSEAARAARVPLNLGFQCMLNGPQLFYHFAELGYEMGKFQSGTGTFGKDGDNCAYGKSTCANYDYKMSPKEAYKMTWTSSSALHTNAAKEVGKIINLRTRILPHVFEGNPTAQDIVSGRKLRYVRWGDDVLVVGNFSASDNQTYTLPSGTWYDYLNGGTTASLTYTLTPGTIKIFTGQVITDIPEVLAKDVQKASIKKVVLDGKMYIVRDGKWYDVMGNMVR